MDPTYIPNSIKVALGIGNCTLGIYSLVVTQEKHCIVFVCSNAQCPIANDQLPKQPLLNLVYIRGGSAQMKGVPFSGWRYMKG